MVYISVCVCVCVCVFPSELYVDYLEPLRRCFFERDWMFKVCNQSLISTAIYVQAHLLCFTRML